MRDLATIRKEMEVRQKNAEHWAEAYTLEHLKEAAAVEARVWGEAIELLKGAVTPTPAWLDQTLNEGDGVYRP